MRSFDIVAIGEAMVEFNQVPGGDGRQYLQGFGGDTSNTVIAAARQGARCAYLSRVGDDDFGRMLLALWKAEGIDAGGVAVDPQAHTGLYFVRHDDSGHRFSYLRAGSAASRMSPAEMPLKLLRSAAFLHVSGISQAISESAAQTVAAAVHLARDARVQVAYDPNLRLRLWPLERARDTILATIPLCDWFLPSLDDVQLLSGIDDPDALVRWSHALGARNVVLKLGRAGCIVSDGQQRTAIPAHRVEAVDATGAGDCFDGVLLARLAAGATPVQAARWATAAAALTTTAYGAVEPLPDGAAVERQLRRTRPHDAAAGDTRP